jgi:hypothetical protein
VISPFFFDIRFRVFSTLFGMMTVVGLERWAAGEKPRIDVSELFWCSIAM